MKIAIASSSLPPGFGISRYVDEISRWFYNHNYEIIVFVTDTRDIDPEKYEYPVHITKIPNSPVSEFELIEEFYDAMLNFLPDILLINDCIYASNILPSLPNTCLRISIIHGYRPGVGFDGHRLLTAAALHNHQYLNWIVSTNKSMNDGLKNNYKIPEEKIKTIYNGVQIVEPSDNSKLLKYNGARITMLFAGGLNRAKGWDVLREAVKILERSGCLNWKLIWVGVDGIPPKSLNTSNILKNAIEYKGVIPHKLLLELLSQTHILIMPSRAEACPMLLLDGMAMGAVPVVSDCPSAMKEIVNDSNCGLISKTGSAKKLANQLSILLSKPEQIGRMSKSGVEYYKKNLRIDNTCNSLLKLIEEEPVNSIQNPKPFPSGKVYPFHRRAYKYSKFNPMGLYERLKLIFGFLPPDIKYLP